MTGIDAGFLILGRNSHSAVFRSDPAGNPALGLPVVLAPDAAGAGGASTTRPPSPASPPGPSARPPPSATFGSEINVSRALVVDRGLRLEGALGFTHFGIREELFVGTDRTALVPFAGFGGTVNPGDRITTLDRYRASTDFYGPQLALRWTSSNGPLTCGAAVRVGLGASEMVYQLDGGTSVTSGGGTLTVPNGLTVLDTNAGRHYRSTFAVLVGGDFTLAYAVTDRLVLRLGYSFTYLSNAARPGLVANRNVDQTRVPLDATFGTGPLTNQPTFAFTDQGFWVQGVTLGVEFRF